MTAIAILGVGRIGLPLLGRLTGAGFRVIAHDVRAEPAVAARDLGAEWASEPDAAVRAADVVITVLPGTPELRSLMAGERDLLARWPAGTVWLDLTSTAPDVAAELAETCVGYGIEYVAAPLGGGVTAMREGTVTLFVGGAAGVVDRLRPVLRAFASDIRFVGDQRVACAAKLLINAAWFGQALLYTEVLLLAREAGIAPARMREVLLDSAADSTFVRRYLPVLLAGDYLADFGIDRCVEELAAVQRLAADAPHEVLGIVTRLHREALEEFGPVDGELLGAALLERRAGHPLSGSGAGDVGQQALDAQRPGPQRGTR